MAAEKNSPSEDASASKHAKDKSGEQPEWANGLKQLYDSVVDEPLPDSFKDLLSKLDDDDGSDEASKGDLG